jgi:short-subunit dehydrogenase involved in D-alanine esterification of teichoic acids
MLCRSPKRGQAALEEICRQTSNPDVELMLADLSSQASIRKFVETFSQRFDHLNGLLNCAGIRVLNHRENEDGIELMFGTDIWDTSCSLTC